MKVAVLLVGGTVGPHDQAALATALALAASSDVVALALVEAGAASGRQWSALPVDSVMELPVAGAGGPVGADFRRVAEALAATLERLEVEVLIVGHPEAPELELLPFTVGARAEWATIPAVTQAKRGDRADALEVEARVGGAQRTLRVPLPVVLEVRAAAAQPPRKQTKATGQAAGVRPSASSASDWLAGGTSGSSDQALGAKVSLPARKSRKITGAIAVVDACTPHRR